MTEQIAPGPERSADPAPRRRYGIFVVPAIASALIAAVFGWGLQHSTDDLPSTLIGKPVPDFELPPVQGRTLGLSSADLRGEVSLVNVFASWCVACRAEHPLLMALNTNDVVSIHGLNYKDRPEDAADWLDTLGDPYTRTGADIDGRVAIDWGVYGVPETFVIGADGRIVYKQIGPISRRVLDEKILPLVRKLQAEAGKVGTR
ncbi:MAG: DsbE family thiol:disulfide interchange protein [Paracoccaceae bacterium]